LMDTTPTGWKPAEVDCCVYIFYKSVYGNRPHFLKFMLTMSMCSEIHPKISFFFIKNKCKKCQINRWSCYLFVSRNISFIKISERMPFNAKWVIFQLYHGENKLHSMKWWWCPLCSRPTRLVGSF
jgi:hypothetical protein